MRHFIDCIRGSALDKPTLERVQITIHLVLHVTSQRVHRYSTPKDFVHIPSRLVEQLEAMRRLPVFER